MSKNRPTICLTTKSCRIGEADDWYITKFDLLAINSFGSSIRITTRIRRCFAKASWSQCQSTRFITQLQSGSLWDPKDQEVLGMWYDKKNWRNIFKCLVPNQDPNNETVWLTLVHGVKRWNIVEKHNLISDE